MGQPTYKLRPAAGPKASVTGREGEGEGGIASGHWADVAEAAVRATSRELKSAVDDVSPVGGGLMFCRRSSDEVGQSAVQCSAPLMQHSANTGTSLVSRSYYKYKSI